MQVLEATLSLWHMLVLLVIVIIFAGPSKIEGLGSSLGKAIRGFKKGISDEEKENEDKNKKS